MSLLRQMHLSQHFFHVVRQHLYLLLVCLREFRQLLHRREERRFGRRLVLLYFAESRLG